MKAMKASYCDDAIILKNPSELGQREGDKQYQLGTIFHIKLSIHHFRVMFNLKYLGESYAS